MVNLGFYPTTATRYNRTGRVVKKKEIPRLQEVVPDPCVNQDVDTLDRKKNRLATFGRRHSTYNLGVQPRSTSTSPTQHHREELKKTFSVQNVLGKEESSRRRTTRRRSQDMDVFGEGYSFDKPFNKSVLRRTASLEEAHNSPPKSMRFQLQRAVSQPNIPFDDDSDGDSLDSMTSQLWNCPISHSPSQVMSASQNRKFPRSANKYELPPRSPSGYSFGYNNSPNRGRRRERTNSKTIWGSTTGVSDSSVCSSVGGDFRSTEEYVSSKEGSYSSDGTTTSRGSYSSAQRRQQIIDGLRNRTCSFSNGFDEHTHLLSPKEERQEELLFQSRHSSNNVKSTRSIGRRRLRPTRRATEVAIPSPYEPYEPAVSNRRPTSVQSDSPIKAPSMRGKDAGRRSISKSQSAQSLVTSHESKLVNLKSRSESSQGFEYDFPLWKQSSRTSGMNQAVNREVTGSFEYPKGTTVDAGPENSKGRNSWFNNVIDYLLKADEDDQASEGPSKRFHYTRGQLLGRGTFGEVFMGINSETGSLLAVKQLRNNQLNEDSNSGTRVRKLREEIAVMKSLNHPNIVRYYGSQINEQNGSLEIILEYVSGGSIASLLSQTGSGFSEPIVKKYTNHMLKGVAYLHAKGIIHRDIKGGNVLINDQGIAKLADFGCSKCLLEHSNQSIEASLKNIRGSILWMAPEVVRQTGEGRESADIWSIGATVIEMLTAKHPWPDMKNSVQALLHIASTKVPPPFPSDISSEMADFLNTCLQIDPKNRSTAKQLLNSKFLE